jgi:hypothetical protein
MRKMKIQVIGWFTVNQYLQTFLRILLIDFTSCIGLENFDKFIGY